MSHPEIPETQYANVADYIDSLRRIAWENAYALRKPKVAVTGGTLTKKTPPPVSEPNDLLMSAQ
jgi:hypothetical protein